MIQRYPVTQQELEQRRHAQYHRQHAQALRRRYLAEHRAVARAQVDHLPRTTRHAGEECRGTVFPGAPQQPYADHAGQGGEQRTEENQREMAGHLLDHRGGEVQANTDADDPLPALAAVGDFRKLPTRQAAHQDDRQQ
ncbi:hypothetical protein D3C75_964710 [compost metagenome]